MNQKERDFLKRNIKIEDIVTLSIRQQNPILRGILTAYKNIYKDTEKSHTNEKLSSIYNFRKVKDLFSRNMAKQVTAEELFKGENATKLLERNKEQFENLDIKELDFYPVLNEGTSSYLLIDLSRNIIIKTITFGATIPSKEKMKPISYVHITFRTIMHLNNIPYESYHMMEFIEILCNLIYKKEHLVLDIAYAGRKYNNRLSPIANIRLLSLFKLNESTAKIRCQ